MAEDTLWYGELAATVRVQNLPATRDVVAIERLIGGGWRVCGSAVSSVDGIADIQLRGLPTSRIYAVAVDEWGRQFVAGMVVEYGDVVRPTDFVGWMYQVTQPGVLPSVEPVWWNAREGIPQAVGTAMLQATRHYQPIAHGPVDVDWAEREADEYWANVVALLQFDGNFDDEAGTAWTVTGNASITQVNPLMGVGSLDLLPASTRSGLRVANDPRFGFGAEDFTIEMLFRLRTLARSSTLLDFRPPLSNGPHLLIQVDNGALYVWVSGAYKIGPLPGLIDQGQRVNLVVQRVSGQMQVFVGGAMTSQVEDNTYYTSQQCQIGRNNNTGSADSNFDLDGQVDELRITKGVARYAGNFTPSAAPFPVG